MEKACSCIHPEEAQRKELLEWFQTLMFPDGYAANLRRGVNLSTMRINGRINVKDLELLERLQLVNDNEDEILPLEHGLELLDLRDSDDETYDPANPDEDDYF